MNWNVSLLKWERCRGRKILVNYKIFMLLEEMWNVIFFWEVVLLIKKEDNGKLYIILYI